jgi:hypothetical protein
VKVTKTGKWMARKREKKNDKSGKKMGWEKMKKILRNGPRENRPMTTTKKALSAALRANSTSGKALDETPSNTFAII